MNSRYIHLGVAKGIIPRSQLVQLTPDSRRVSDAINTPGIDQSSAIISAFDRGHPAGIPLEDVRYSLIRPPHENEKGAGASSTRWHELLDTLQTGAPVGYWQRGPVFRGQRSHKISGDDLTAENSYDTDEYRTLSHSIIDDTRHDINLRTFYEKYGPGIRDHVTQVAVDPRLNPAEQAIRIQGLTGLPPEITQALVARRPGEIRGYSPGFEWKTGEFFNMPDLAGNPVPTVLVGGSAAGRQAFGKYNHVTNFISFPPNP
jgi:hypothetical protein